LPSRAFREKPGAVFPDSMFVKAASKPNFRATFCHNVIPLF
jgi:hypothetical protein